MTNEPMPVLLRKAAAAYGAGRFDEVEETCRQVLDRYGDEANSLMLMGLVRIRSDSLAEGIVLLERARAANPAHAHVLSNLGTAYRRAGRLHDARAALEAAVAVDARLAPAHHGLGNVLLDLGDREGASSHYRAAAGLQPSYAEPLAALAVMAESDHELDAARGLAERALRAEPGNALARLTRARVLIRTGDSAAAVPELAALVASPDLPAANRVLTRGYLGDALDRLGRYDEAFAQYTAGNELQRAQHAADFAQDRGFVSPPMVDRLRDILLSADADRWPCTAGRRPAPVFLVGFPRSGTTLLEQVLASHPAVDTLEERETLVEACEELLAPGVDSRGWRSRGATDVEALQDRYWSRVAQFLPESGRRPVLVDKFPLNAVLLPVIHWLFRDARIILMLRDPRDVVLSCYQQRFGMNGAMYQLLSLDTAAAYYDRVMGLVRECRRLLPLQVHEVHYEEIVRNFDPSVRALLEFLDLPWSDSVRGYADTAKRRRVQTPSSSQVVQQLYTSSIGKWRNYRRHMQHVLPVLEPWVSQLGYPSSGPG